MRPIRWFICVVLAVCLPATPAHAQLETFQTAGLRLIYFNGTETYLVPHAARTFLNSLAFQRRIFGLDPAKAVTVLLVDFSDAGNASATVVPRNNLTVDISPLSYEFETLATNERLNTIMNHELVHIATMDPPAKRDRMFRRLFGGKVMPLVDDPESIFYFFLTTPRVAAPRWYHEGIAVFMDTWMAGGMGRAQSGYDEMVFRGMVRDGSRFFDPLGLVSAGTKIDFQLQINSYLYGTRFMTWLARRYSPAQLVSWVSRRDGSRAYYAAAFKQVFGVSIEQAWQNWIADERAFQTENLKAVNRYPLTPYHDVAPRALGSVSRAYYDPVHRQIYAAFDYPGVVAHVGAIRVDDGSVHRIADVKGPVIYTVTSLAWDPGTRTLFYTTDNGAHRDLMALDPDTRRTHLLLKDARIGDLAFNRADSSLWGIRHLNGICTIVRIPKPYRQWEQVTTLPYGTVVYDLDVSPDGRYLSASFGEVTGQQDVRVFETDTMRKGALNAITRFDFGASVPSGFVFSPDGRFLYGSCTLPACRTSSVRPFIADVNAVSNTDVGFFRPIRSTTGSCSSSAIPVRDSFLQKSRHGPLDDVSPITFLGERLAEERPEIKTWNVGLPSSIPLDSMPQETAPYHIARSLRRESFYPIVQGYKNTAAVGMRFNFSDPVQLNRANVTLAWSPSGVPSSEEVHVNAEYSRTTGGAASNGTRVTSTICSVQPRPVARATSLVSGITIRSCLTSRGVSSSISTPKPPGISISCRLYQNVAVDITRLYSARAKLAYSDIRNSLGNVDDETGRQWSIVAEGNYVDGSRVPIFSRYLRPRLGGFGRPLVGLASQCRRSVARQRERPVRERLLRGIWE